MTLNSFVIYDISNTARDISSRVISCGMNRMAFIYFHFLLSICFCMLLFYLLITRSAVREVLKFHNMVQCL